MAVNLSPVAGAAAQFFDNSGNVLTGGKLYTYDAGTTTPAPTYTTSSGVTAHANPIVLNAAGRVPDSGEIWLSDSVSYKFVLKDSNDVLIGTYDNLVGINSNFVNFTGEEETQTATQGQTVFTLTTLTYQPTTNNLLVFVNGSKQVEGVNYIETSSTIVTFVDGLNVGDVVDFCTATPINTSAIDASQVNYNEGGIDAVNQTVEAKLQQIVSVQDFGAVGDGITDDTAAIQAAIAAVKPALPGNPWDLNGNAGGTVYLPTGKYKVSSTIVVPAWVNLKGAGKSATQIVASGNPGTVVSMGLPGLAPANDPLQSYHCSISGLTIYGSGLNTIGLAIYASFWMMFDVEVTYCNYHGIYLKTSYTGKAYNTYSFYNATTAGYAGIYMDGAGVGIGANDITFFGGSIGNCYDSVGIKECNGVTFDGLSIQSSKRYAFNFDDTGNPVGITVCNCYFESNAEQVAGTSFYGVFSFVTIENNYFAGVGTNATRYISASAMNGCKIINNLFGSTGATAFIGLVNESASSLTFVRNLILGNSSEDSSIPLFTTAMKALVDANLYAVGAAPTSRVDYATQYYFQASFLSSYTATLTPSTSGTITLSTDANTVTYTKAGRLVTLQGTLNVASVSSPIGTYVKMSLPYEIGGFNSTASQFGGAIYCSPDIYGFEGDAPGQSYILIFVDASTVNGKSFKFSFSYLTV